ncbi:MAG: YraN family protein [Clostridia bacterium]|nr:YraN family protein [Clostridia bacterium]
MNTREIGSWGEELACKELKKEKYKILETNYHASKLAEIDVIAQKKDLLVFVEVKLRQGASLGAGREAVNFQKQQHIRYAAKHYLTCKIKKEVSCRFDVIEITLCDGLPTIVHIENAF